MILEEKIISIIGLGYVGLPLAIEFGKKYDVKGFDIDRSRIEELKNGIDRTNEAQIEELKAVTKMSFSDKEGKGIYFSSELNDLNSSNVFIITVPTPIDEFKVPDLLPLKKASQMVGGILKEGDIVIYESTVYPGCTEEECVPILEKYSGLRFNQDFFCGYSPERINPGDKINTLTKIKKVTSGSTAEVALIVDELYKSIISAGTHLASSMKVAEASKAIENAQRDVNISFVNELALIFDRLGIDTNEVLAAAATKWNFINFKPGLVGGHCISVDPYYLAYKAEKVGYHPAVILSGRRVNDAMGLFIANKVVKLMIQKGNVVKGARVLILGFTFKENCPDIRNTRVVDIYQELKQFGIDVVIYDPWASQNEVMHEYGITMMPELTNSKYHAIIVAVAHEQFVTLNYENLKADGNAVIFDIKGFLDKRVVDSRL